MVPFSILDLSMITEGGDAREALHRTLDLAQLAERLGFTRYWLAEHHNMPGIASAATSVVIGYVAGGTSTIRVGSGGIMLPNHSPLVVAEQFGTLESLYPGRIDLGLGRAPGTDQPTARALRRGMGQEEEDSFPRDVLALLAYFGPVQPGQTVRAIPGAGLNVPIWILGSSVFGAQLAAALGLPFGFASHFAPAMMMEAVRLYRAGFRPSAWRAAPHVMLALNVCAAETDAAARPLFSSIQQTFLSLRRGRPGPLPPPVENFEDGLSDGEMAMLGHALSCSVVGSPDTVRRGIERFVAETGADELMITSPIFDHAARRRSVEITAAIHGGISGARR
jgi:luciferase family oxidoreductase group 1